MASPTVGPTLARRPTTRDAVFIGVGSMVGAGLFTAFTPAAAAAGSGLLVSLGIAAARTIPRAIVLSFAVVVPLCAVTAVLLLHVLGPGATASTGAPLHQLGVMVEGHDGWLAWVASLAAGVAALTQEPRHRRYPRALTLLGLAGCVLLALAVPVGSLAARAAVLAIGVLGRLVLGRRRSSSG